MSDSTDFITDATRALISREVGTWLLKPFATRPSLLQLIADVIELEGKRVEQEWSDEGFDKVVSDVINTEREAWFLKQVKVRGYVRRTAEPEKNA
jgi:hypothetical protein